MTLSKQNRESGVALLVSLGMLSLLLVTVVSFIFTAKVDLLVSDFHIDDSSSKTFSRDSNAMLFNPLEARGTTSPRLQQQFSHANVNPDDWPLVYDYTSDTSKNAKWQNRGVLKFNGDQDASAISYNLGFMATPENINEDSLKVSNSKIAWWTHFGYNDDVDLDQEFDDEEGQTQIDWSDQIQKAQKDALRNITNQYTAILGRYTYIAVDESVKFDLNGILYNQDNELIHSELYDLKEMFDYFSLDKSALTNGLDQRPELNKKKRFWESWRHIWNSKAFAKDPDFPKLSEERKARDAYNVFTPYTFPSGEFMYYIPKDLKNEWTQRQFIHRFFVGNLSNISNPDTLISAPMTSQKRFDFFDTEKFSSGVSASTVAVIEQEVVREQKNEMTQMEDKIYKNTEVNFIPWLARIAGNLDNNNGEHSKRLQRQVTANLMDYCDANKQATTDYNSSLDYTGEGDLIDYCGLEKSAYTAAVAPGLTFTAISPGQPDTNYYISSLMAKVKLINIYDTASSVQVTLRIPSINIGGNEIKVDKRGSASISCPANGEAQVEVKISELINDVEIESNKTIEIPSVIIELSSDGLSDVTLIKNVGGGSAKILHGIPLYTSVKFHDPRCNNYVFANKPDDAHTKLYTSEISNSWTSKSDIDVKPNCTDNSMYTDDSKTGRGTLIDKESDVFALSTAFIRDDQITSLWELGCIHRGEPWRTLNLKRSCKLRPKGNAGQIVSQVYDHSVASGDTSLEWERDDFYYTGTYPLGDAALLNQLKLTAQIETYPMINVLSRSKDYWGFIIEKVFKSDKSYSNRFTGTTGKIYVQDSQLDSKDVTGIIQLLKTTNIAGELGDKEGLWNLCYKNSKSTNSRTVRPGFDHLKNKNDFYAEELIGKIADQAKINYNLYRFVCTYQKLAYMSKAQSITLDNIASQSSDNPRLNGYTKLEFLGEDGGVDDSWYKIMGQQKSMSIMRRPKDTGRFELIENIVLESF